MEKRTIILKSDETSESSFTGIRNAHMIASLLCTQEHIVKAVELKKDELYAIVSISGNYILKVQVYNKYLRIFDEQSKNKGFTQIYLDKEYDCSQLITKLSEIIRYQHIANKNINKSKVKEIPNHSLIETSTVEGVVYSVDGKIMILVCEIDSEINGFVMHDTELKYDDSEREELKSKVTELLNAVL